MPQKPVSADLKFRAFSDRTRLRLLHLLLHGELCVCDLVAVIQVPQPTASRHLAYLRKSGLVTTQKKGLWTHYSLAPAKSRLDRKLRECLALGPEEIPELRLDQVRLGKLKKRRGCC